MPQKKAQVMVLGTYHMNNPGQDVYNMEADDVLAAKRQAEIKELVAALAKFQPTKIAIERSVDTKSDSLEQLAFRQYLDGNRKLNRNEDEQIGFRLAKQLGHKKIYCVDDSTTDFPFNNMVEYATQHNQLQALARGQKMGEMMVKEMSDKLGKMTIS
ncbi:MAG: DUF5694 domain-containing protein, partial [Bacteroidota bacterium]